VRSRKQREKGKEKDADGKTLMAKGKKQTENGKK
jgi:hypothetical protein